MIDEVSVFVEVGRKLGSGVDDIEGHCIVHHSSPRSGLGQLNDRFASRGLMACNILSYSRKVRELSGVLGMRGRHPDFFANERRLFVNVGKVMDEDVAERTASIFLSATTFPIRIVGPLVP